LAGHIKDGAGAVGIAALVVQLCQGVINGGFVRVPCIDGLQPFNDDLALTVFQIGSAR